MLAEPEQVPELQQPLLVESLVVRGEQEASEVGLVQK
jgi:hypothetical protein